MGIKRFIDFFYENAPVTSISTGKVPSLTNPSIIPKKSRKKWIEQNKKKKKRKLKAKE
jgi:hypothetical protein|tara:strand:+ start:2026 stop:2199 length:174 start_codon:yes stop_codon:yes gene_type:complete